MTYAISKTAQRCGEDRRGAREAGLDLHLLKPADPDELRRVLASAEKLTRPASA